ncbi:MAG: hypothetical protein FD187_2252 [bacterium]|nr:MAG: hypothetical protein FD142_2775 [bacterium]KAF0148039.1 MAG: hypothetical protein FD187_2252 [bacterium]KAF0167555.1 MAG: hypothetical protein FD158_2133 [bacterium]TXT16641.1 MAG: hypothetical protein FD132_2750 [bacterium]
MQIVLEAMHRFQQETQDSRSAAALTLAWAMLESGYLGSPLRQTPYRPTLA